MKVIGPSHEDFWDRANKIVEIYNEESSVPFSELLDVSNSNTINLIYIDGIDGGVITDAWYNKNDEFLFHSIMYAAFPKADRQKGYLKACVNSVNFKIETVQINAGDPVEIWKKLGFKKLGLLNFTMMLRTRDFDGVNWGLVVLKKM
ncbi:hypothetical protein EIJ81_00380 (plasmid) [Aliivibrio salmonicida]|uniref:hypothetical protein n=1 Tax=Aliivibrio salmonicida TaxID=40269 RepID=UPI000F6D2A23|nr:hypothetical protein [Aliivibrio salmonicida]AZL83356.1 hypothetical protein EIJ81_00380 [Aliivibrio salmonicida]